MADLQDPHALVGTWRLARVIDDRLAGARSLVDGELTLTVVSPARIRWEESGQWHQPTGDVAVRRCLWLVRDEDTGAWWVRFEDERDFHPWVPGESVVHPCAPDTYRGVVRGTPQGWTVDWEVTGPAKDYSMSTELTRLSERGERDQCLRRASTPRHTSGRQPAASRILIASPNR